jgi:hypothetical protein
MDFREIGFVWFGKGLVMGSCEHSNELLGPLECRDVSNSLLTINFSRDCCMEFVGEKY